MKKIFLLFVFIILFGGYAIPQDSIFIPYDNIILLDASDFEDSTWILNNDDIVRVKGEIEKFLINPNVDNSYDSLSVIKIRSNIKNYSVQLSGEYRDGRKIIWCNFFPTSDLKYLKYDLTKIPHIVMDGGYFYWSITFEIERNMLFNFFVNGEA